MYHIQHPVVLESQRIRLEPLDKNHFDALLDMSGQKDIWTYLSINGHDKELFLTDLKSALLLRASKEQYPFAIVDKLNNKIIGSTRLYHFYPEHLKLEIGWTFYHPAYWGTGYNTECKLLLLTYCFETLGTIRVQFQTHEHNQRSRGAIAKIGASFEGILRNDRMRADGTKRNSAIFSIIDTEWPEVKAMLTKKVDQQ